MCDGAHVAFKVGPASHAEFVSPPSSSEAVAQRTSPLLPVTSSASASKAAQCDEPAVFPAGATINDATMAAITNRPRINVLAFIRSLLRSAPRRLRSRRSWRTVNRSTRGQGSPQAVDFVAGGEAAMKLDVAVDARARLHTIRGNLRPPLKRMEPRRRLFLTSRALKRLTELSPRPFLLFTQARFW